MTAILSQHSASDLWADAVHQLPDEVKQRINFSRPDRLNILDELREDAEISKQESIRSRWKYTRKSGETVVIRDVFDKIIRWVDTFKQIGDIAMQYDPGHAALPWAGIRFLLQIVVNDTHNLALVVEGLAWIAELICRYRMTEVLYIQATSKATEGLERALVKLYAGILVYLCDAKQYFDQRTAKRISKGVVQIKSKLESGLETIHTLEKEMHPWLPLADKNDDIRFREQLVRLLSDMDTPLRRMDESLRDIKDDLSVEERSKIVRWLSPEPYKQHHNQTLEDVLPETGRWLLSDPVFKKWKDESASSILWLHGIPGSGKSKLASIVIEDAMDSFKAGNNPQPVFFYCSRNPTEPARSDPLAILASLARQLSSLEPGDPLFRPLVDLYRKEKTEGFASGQPRMKAVCRLITQLVELYPQITIVLDALDECNPTTRIDLLEFLRQLLQDSGSLVKIFLTSRNDQDIVWELSGYPNLAVDSSRNSDDIAKFVNVEVERLIRRRQLLRHSESRKAQMEMKQIIISKVIHGAAGMFRWASLQLQHLSSYRSDISIYNSLGRLPNELFELYELIYKDLTKVPDKLEATICRNVLSWLLCAQRALRTEEFLAMVSIDFKQDASITPISKDLVLDICNNFVVFDSQLDTFRFAHLSVREYLEKRSDFEQESVNKLIAEICLWSVISEDDEPATKAMICQANLRAKAVSHWSQIKSHWSCDQLAPQETVLAYSCHYWTVHCNLAGRNRGCGTLGLLLRHLFRTKSSFVRWILQLLAYERWHWDRTIVNQIFDTTTLQNTKFVEYLTGFSHDMNRPSYQEIQSELQEKFSTEPCISHFSKLYLCCTFDFEEYIDGILEDLIHEDAYLEEPQRNERILPGLDLAATRAAKHGSYRSLACLLTKHWPNIEISEELVAVAAGNSDYGKELITLLLGVGGTKVVITEKAVQTAAGNEGSGKEVMLLLLSRLKEEIPITAEGIKQAASYQKYGREVIRFLLEQPGANAMITAETVKAAAGNRRYAIDVLLVFLERLGTTFPATLDALDTIISTVSSWSTPPSDELDSFWHYGGPAVSRYDWENCGDWLSSIGDSDSKKMMLLFISRLEANVRIGDDLLVRMAGLFDKDVVALLLDRLGADIRITNDLLVRMVFDKDVFALLLDRLETETPISIEVVEAAIRNGEQVTTLLIERRESEVLEVLERLMIYGFERISKKRVRVALPWGRAYFKRNETADSAMVQ